MAGRTRPRSAIAASTRSQTTPRSKPPPGSGGDPPKPGRSIATVRTAGTSSGTSRSKTCRRSARPCSSTSGGADSSPARETASPAARSGPLLGTVAAAATAVAPGALAAIAAAAAGAVAVAGRALTAALAGVRELLLVADADRLGRDLGAVLRLGDELETDAAALGVDLGHLDRDDVASGEHLVDGVDAHAGRDPRGVQEAVGALAELHEGAEIGRLDDLAVAVDGADADRPRHLLDALPAALAHRRARGVDADEAVLLDVDLAVELLLEAADRLAALADDEPDLVGVDLDGDDLRCVRGELGARLGDGLRHALEDRQPGLARLRQRLSQQVGGDARDLDVHLQGGDAVLRARDLEVHVAEVILGALDVGQHDGVVALLDEPHGDACHRRLDRHAG